MREVSYAVADHLFDPDRDVPNLHSYAILCEGRIVRRTRSNGQTFDLTYRSEFSAKEGLRMAQREFELDCELWSRYDEG